MVTLRRGASTLGCLFVLLIIAAAAYVGKDFGEAYWAYYQYKDSMKQELAFRADQPDEKIRTHMQLVADSLGLPEEAGKVKITRDSRTKVITLESAYDVTVAFPGYERDLHFEPRAEDTY